MNRILKIIYISVTIGWIMLMAFGCIAILDVIRTYAAPNVIMNGEYVICEIHTQDNAVDINEAPPIDDISVVLEQMDEEVVDNPYRTIRMTDEEAEELRWVIALEAQGEVSKVGLNAEIAVCEVIFNRLLSTKNWGSSIHDVLSKRGQFSTYKYINSSKAWCRPGETEDDAISECIRRGPSVLPDMAYVYFDSRGGVNGSRKYRLGNHVFGAER